MFSRVSENLLTARVRQGRVIQVTCDTLSPKAKGHSGSVSSANMEIEIPLEQLFLRLTISSR
jgi:hypothetical protein